MTSTTENAAGVVADIQRFVADWYAALDRHVPWEEVEPYLGEQIRFVFPEVTVTTYAGLRDWYTTVTHRFFDEAHRVDVADVDLDGDRARVHVLVNWRTRVWDPPAATSQVLEYEADQSWVVELVDGNRPVLRDYVVNDLLPQGDTPALF